MGPEIESVLGSTQFVSMVSVSMVNQVEPNWHQHSTRTRVPEARQREVAVVLPHIHLLGSPNRERANSNVEAECSA